MQGAAGATFVAPVLMARNSAATGRLAATTTQPQEWRHEMANRSAASSGRKRRFTVLTAVSLATAVVLAACGSSKKSTTSSSSSPSNAVKADASLPPVLVGFINQEAGASGAYPQPHAAAQAAVDYINAELGGVDKHPLKLDVCVTDGTAASSQKCAGQMVTDKVLFVTGGLDTQLPTQYPTLDAAGIPYIGGVPISSTDYNAKNASFFVAGGAATYPGLAAYILKFMPNAKKVGVLANENGSAVALAAVTKPLEAANVKLTTVKVPNTQADWLAPFAQVKDNDAIAVTIGAPNCISLAKARASQQSTVPVVSVSTCYSKATIDGAGQNGLDGWIVNQYFDDPAGDTADAKLYQRVMKQYGGPNVDMGGFAPIAFSDVVTFTNNALKPIGFDKLTTKAVVDKVRDPAGGKVFMGPDYKCGAADAPYTAICNYQLQFFKVKAGALTAGTGFIDIAPTIRGLPKG